MQKDIFESKLFRTIILSIAGLIILATVFGLGVSVGIKKAEFSFKWADQYHRNFGGPQGGIFGEFMGTGKEFSNSNGSYGQIIKIDNNILTVKDNDGDSTEKNILVSDKTIIIFQRKNIKLSDLKLGTNITVIGEPDNNGQIQAELIRVMPSMPINLPPDLQNNIPTSNPSTPTK